METIYPQWIFRSDSFDCSFCHLSKREKFSGNRVFLALHLVKFVVFRYRNKLKFMLTFPIAIQYIRLLPNAYATIAHVTVFIPLVSVLLAIFLRGSHTHTHVFMWRIYEKRESDSIKLLLFVKYTHRFLVYVLSITVPHSSHNNIVLLALFPQQTVHTALACVLIGFVYKILRFHSVPWITCIVCCCPIVFCIVTLLSSALSSS